jgi:hypothetical protein
VKRAIEGSGKDFGKSSYKRVKGVYHNKHFTTVILAFDSSNMQLSEFHSFSSGTRVSSSSNSCNTAPQ